MRHLVINTDGACRGNPGPAGIGFVIRERDKVIKEFSYAIGDATNNIAEYLAVVYALQAAIMFKADTLQVITDSELLFNQVTGSYKVKNPNIKPFFDLIQHLISGFRKVEFQHVLREHNSEADKLASAAVKDVKAAKPQQGSLNFGCHDIKQEQAKVVASLFNKGEESPSSKG